MATPVAAAPAATPLGGTPGATPLAATPTAALATPNPDAALATAEAGYAQFADTFFDLGHLSQQDYERLVAAPALARQKVADALGATVGQSAPQVHASHILLPTQEEAEAARQRVSGGEDFATVARELSTDTATAGNGGDLGWFTREEMVPAFADAAFALQPGAISDPVQTEFGWHIIEVAESDPDRPLTDAQIQRVKQAEIEHWVEQEQAALGVTSTLPPTPTPFASTFQPPVSAPPPPTPTPLPATPAATPVG
jgi:peptidyl-prolyl cis-trans isomerase C